MFTDRASSGDGHDPVYVQERGDGLRVPAGQFCNYANLASSVQDENPVTDACCEWSPD